MARIDGEALLKKLPEVRGRLLPNAPLADLTWQLNLLRRVARLSSRRPYQCWDAEVWISGGVQR